MTTPQPMTAPTYAHFRTDDSMVLVVAIRDDTARVMNEDGEWWDEPVDRLYPAEPGVTW